MRRSGVQAAAGSAMLQAFRRAKDTDRLVSNFAFVDMFFKMSDILSSSVVQAVLGILVLMVLVAIGYQVVLKLRDSASNSSAEPDSLLSNFAEMRFGGGISDAEFRTIRSVLERKSQSGAAPKATGDAELSPAIDRTSEP